MTAQVDDGLHAEYCESDELVRNQDTENVDSGGDRVGLVIMAQMPVSKPRHKVFSKANVKVIND